jgi:hypothetical protein
MTRSEFLHLLHQGPIQFLLLYLAVCVLAIVLMLLFLCSLRAGKGKRKEFRCQLIPGRIEDGVRHVWAANRRGAWCQCRRYQLRKQQGRLVAVDRHGLTI